MLSNHAQSDSELPGQKSEALLILVGITAGCRKRRHVLRFFRAHCHYDVFVPALPYRKPLREVAAWFSAYLEKEVRPERYEKLNAIAYIAARHLLNCLPAREKPLFERMIYFRGPIQELVGARLVRRIGRLLTSLIKGRTAVDLADGWPAALPPRRQGRHEALIIEMGGSRLARLLGITDTEIPEEVWAPQQLLPTAEAILHVSQSHDDVYTSDSILASALGFIQHGAFPVREGVMRADTD